MLCTCGVRLIQPRMHVQSRHFMRKNICFIFDLSVIMVSLERGETVWLVIRKDTMHRK